MTEAPYKEGSAPFMIPGIEKACSTYYKVFGDLSCGSPRLICLHGGPGAGHQVCLPFTEFGNRCGLPVILYDQVGCGLSTQFPEKRGDDSFWQMDLFIAELNSLIDYLQLRDGPGFYLLGGSFGGMLASDFATQRPRGLKKLVLVSPNASRALSVQGQELRRRELPISVQQALNEANEKRIFDSKEYKDALLAFRRHAICRADPLPDFIKALLLNTKMNDVFLNTSGPAPTLLGEGSMRNWNVIPRLHRIEVPTLVTNGEWDTSHDVSVRPFFEHVPRVRWITFAGASHVITFEGEVLKNKFMKTVEDFLNQKIEQTAA